jgi:hypothetical protein
MIAAKNIANRWYSQVAGLALIALGITGLSLPAPTAALRVLEDKAVRQLAPVAAKSEIGRELLAVYVARNVECHRSL